MSFFVLKWLLGYAATAQECNGAHQAVAETHQSTRRPACLKGERSSGNTSEVPRWKPGNTGCMPESGYMWWRVVGLACDGKPQGSLQSLSAVACHRPSVASINQRWPNPPVLREQGWLLLAPLRARELAPLQNPSPEGPWALPPAAAAAAELWSQSRRQGTVRKLHRIPQPLLRAALAAVPAASAGQQQRCPARPRLGWPCGTGSRPHQPALHPSSSS